VFRMAANDYELQRANLLDEEATLAGYFAARGGLSLETIRRLAPTAPANWPGLPKGSGEWESPSVVAAQGELESATAAQALTRSESSLNLSAGPTLNSQTIRGQRSNVWGGGLTMTLPALSFGSGKRAVAAQARANAETTLAITKQ